MENDKMMVFGTQKRAGQWYYKCFDCGEMANFLEFAQTHQCPAGGIAVKPRRTKQTKSRAAAVKAKLRYKVGSKMEVGKSK